MGHADPDVEKDPIQHGDPAELFREFVQLYPAELADRLDWLEECLDIRHDRLFRLGVDKPAAPAGGKPPRPGAAAEWKHVLARHKHVNGLRVEECLARYLSLFQYNVPQARQYLKRDASELRTDVRAAVPPGVDVESDAVLMTLILTGSDNLFLPALTYFLNKIEPRRD